MKKQQGFTLIELVVVIVILGILAATALPKFVDLTSDAGNAAAQGVAGAISSGTVMNYAARKAGHTTGTTQLTAANVCTATLLTNFVSGITLSSSAATNNTTYKVSGTGDCSSTTGAGDGGTVSCDITGQNGSAQPVTVTCAN